MTYSQGFQVSACLLALLLPACASTGGGRQEKAASSRPTSSPGAAGETAEDETDEGLRRALAESIRRPGSWAELHLAVECQSEGGMRSLEVFGNGVAVWANRRQFDLPVADVAHLLSLLEEADFVGMEDQYGGGSEEDSATMITCRVQLELNGMKKESVQLFKGEQSAEFRDLADSVLDSCADRGEAGVSAADLREGLEKVAAGELAPEVLTVMLHRKPDDRSAGAGARGFLLRLAGPRVVTRAYGPAAGYGEPLALELDPGEVEDLARSLADGDPASLPANLWAEHYTDLSIQVLNRRKAVQARQFARLTPTTHGRLQEAFDTLYATLEAIHERALASGRPARDEE